MFSGTPPPPSRRIASSARRSRAAASVPASGQTTPRNGSPAPSTAALPLTSRTLGQRLQGLNDSPAPSTRRGGRSVTGRSEAGSVMDVDSSKMNAQPLRAEDETEKVLVRDTGYVVLERRGLPSDVEGVVTSADPYTDPFRSSLDTLTGFALLITRDFCLVWNWARRSSSSTTYIFPLSPSTSLPATVSPFSPLSYASFVPTSTQPSQREPGLLNVSTTGEIRYWEKVSMALNRAAGWKAADAGLAEGELVRGIQLLTPTSYLISTSRSRIIVITISAIGGRVELGVRPFERAVGWAGSFLSSIFRSKTTEPRAGILALALTKPLADGERIAYAVAEKSVQVWKLQSTDEGEERLLIEQDVFAAVLEGLAGNKVGNEEWALNEGRVEILDAIVAPNGSLAVLVSHVAEYTAPNSLSYAVVLLDIGTTQNSATVADIRHISYQAHPDPRPLSTPQLSLQGGDIAFVVFVDAVVMLSLAQNSSFEESFPLRSNTHRFLGFSTPPPSTTRSSSPSITLLTSTASLLSVEVAVSLLEDAPSSADLKTRKLKHKIEHAVYFGGQDADNPLAFDLQPDFEGDLIAAAEAVSAEILSSSSAHMPSILDLRAQLADRASRARGLIDYINSSGIRGKLSQSSRHQLSADAERLAAAGALWQYQNARLGGGSSLLEEAITTVMYETGRAQGDDDVRLFFRTAVASIGELIEEVSKLAKAALAASVDAEVRSQAVKESNHVVLIIMNAVARHRETATELYGLNPQTLSTESWSSTPSMLEVLQWHFDATEALLRERARDFGSMTEGETMGSQRGGSRRGVANDVDSGALAVEFKSQMARLADFVWAMMEERLLLLRTIVNSVHGGSTSPELKSLTERYALLRPRFISTLVSIDKVTHAYELAERHRDFTSLVTLSHSPLHGSPQRIQFFIHKYDQDFAFEFFRYLVEAKKLKELVECEEEYRVLLTKFFDETKYPRISWLNDVTIGRYAEATEALVGESSREKSLAQKQLMLSIAKLSQVAQSSSETLHTEPVQRAIEAIDDQLDLINSQSSLLALFTSQIPHSASTLPLSTLAPQLTSRLCPSLEPTSVSYQVYAKCVKDVLEGVVVSPEDQIDLLTIKDCRGDLEGDYSAALEVLVRAKDMPEGRQRVALENIWRRVYLADDWKGLRSTRGMTDEDIATSLRHTALLHTLTAASGADHPSSMYLSPAQSLSTASPEEITARFPDAPPALVPMILSEYAAESEQIERMRAEDGLEEFVEEVGRLRADMMQ